MITDTNRVNFLLAEGAYQSREQIDEMMVATAGHEPGVAVQPQTDDQPRPPLRFCVRCGAPIDPKRVMRGSAFCDTECRREDMKERRAFKASKACRLCGRKARPKPTAKPPEALCDGSTEEKSLLCQPS